jgi:hypothetical protein
MYVRGYLQGSENGRVVTIDETKEYEFQKPVTEWCINRIL